MTTKNNWYIQAQQDPTWNLHCHMWLQLPPVFTGISCCCCSVTQSCLTLCDPWTAANQASLFITKSQGLLKLMCIQMVMPSNHLILCCPLLLLLSIFPSIRVFSNEAILCIRWPKYWSFSLSISATNVYSGLISFSIDWIDLAVQGTLKSLLLSCWKTVFVMTSAFFWQKSISLCPASWVTWPFS